jgi:magnesium-transporting ATPase (P-type)
MKRYAYYFPIIIVIAIGFFLGAYMAFGIKYMNVLHDQIHSAHAKFLLQLFGMGMLGGSTFCAYFLVNDLHETVYENSNFFPHFFDFASYIFIILSSGITGIILYLLLRTGIKVGVTNSSAVELSNSASLLIAYIGGYCAFKIQKQLNKITDSLFNERKQQNNSDANPEKKQQQNGNP